MGMKNLTDILLVLLVLNAGLQTLLVFLFFMRLFPLALKKRRKRKARSPGEPEKEGDVEDDYEKAVNSERNRIGKIEL